MVMRPNFLIIGAARCGTSSLCARLASHPEVFISEPREPCFFSHDEHYRRGLSWYESHFRHASGAKAVGEGSTTYTKRAQYPQAAERIAHDLPGVQLIYVVRHPLDQIASHYMVLRSHADGAVRSGVAMSASFADSVRQNAVLLDTAMYWRQISAYREHFPDRRIHVVFFEEYLEDAEGTLRGIFEFLGVDREVAIDDGAGVRHASSALLEDRPLLRPLQGGVMARVGRRYTPEVLKGWLRPMVKRRIGQRPTWDAATRSWALEQLRPDAERVLAFYGRSGLWQLA